MAAIHLAGPVEEVGAHERLAGTVWNTGGCGSWYFDRNGRNSIQWPGFTFEYRRRTRSFDAEAYRLAPAAAA